MQIDAVDGPLHPVVSILLVLQASEPLSSKSRPAVFAATDLHILDGEGHARFADQKNSAPPRSLCVAVMKKCFHSSNGRGRWGARCEQLVALAPIAATGYENLLDTPGLLVASRFAWLR